MLPAIFTHCVKGCDWNEWLPNKHIYYEYITTKPDVFRI